MPYPSSPSAYPSDQFYPSGPDYVTGGAVALGGTAHLSETANATRYPTASLHGSSSLGITGPKQTESSAVALRGAGALFAAPEATASLNATSSLTSAAPTIFLGAAVLSGGATLTMARPVSASPLLATLAAHSTLTANPTLIPLIPADFVAATVKAPSTLPTWHVYVADTISGKVLYELPVQTQSWSTKLNGIGTYSATVEVGEALDVIAPWDERDPRTLLREFFTGPYRFSIVAAYGQNAVWAGPYTPGTVPSNAPTFQILANEFPIMFSKRILTNSRTAPASLAGNVTIGPTTKPNVAYQLALNALGDGSVPYQLPFTCSSPPATLGTEFRTYYGYDLNTVWDALSALTQEADGPDVRFQPHLTERSDGLYLSYDMQIGNPLLAKPAPWAWDSPSSASVQWDTNVQNFGSAYFGVGAGQAYQRLIAVESDSSRTNLGYPALELVDSLNSSVSDPDQLASLTLGDMQLYKDPAVKWTTVVQGSRDPYIGLFQVGDTFQLGIERHPVIPDGLYYRRITALSGDLTDFCSVMSSDDYVVMSTTTSGVQVITS